VFEPLPIYVVLHCIKISALLPALYYSFGKKNLCSFKHNNCYAAPTQDQPASAEFHFSVSESLDVAKIYSQHENHIFIDGKSYDENNIFRLRLSKMHKKLVIDDVHFTVYRKYEHDIPAYI
jgi:hypothetical protein